MNEPDEPRSVAWRVTSRDQGNRLDRFLKERIPRMSRERIKEAIRSRVSVTGRARPRPSTLLRTGDEVVVTYPDPPAPASLEAIPPIPVIHADENLLVVDKPAGLRVHATSAFAGPNLLDALRAQDFEEIHLVHRLDRETSGITALPRNLDVARDLSAAFAAGLVGKTYVAVVFGEVQEESGRIDRPLGPDGNSPVHIKQGVDMEKGKAALTEYRVIRRLPGFTFLRLRPRTGRRHQIRVHLAELGHPIVGDKLYGVRETHHLRYPVTGFDEKMRRDLLTERQLLHAARLEIPDPVVGSAAVFEAPLPEDMARFLVNPPS